MKIVFLSNYYNHHQAPFAAAMDGLTNHNFIFIETCPMDETRKNLGWGKDQKPGYVIQAYGGRQKEQECQTIIFEAGAVIWGSCPFRMIRPRLKARKLTFAYSERLFKQGMSGFPHWGRAVKYFLRLAPYQKNHYLLCASAYAAQDYNSIGLFKNKTLKWGYFPETKQYNVKRLISKKRQNSILWAARLIGWKHPEVPVLIAEKLTELGYPFELAMIGDGPLEGQIKNMISQKGLDGCVHMLGAMSPEDVRKHMEEASIFLFTSDQNEGWGAVLNEAMNSGCAVIANEVIGSVPYLLKDGVNGLVVNQCNDINEMIKHFIYCFEHFQAVQVMGQAAYATIRDDWNAKVAAERLMTAIEKRTVAETGVCGKETYNEGRFL